MRQGRIERRAFQQFDPVANYRVDEGVMGHESPQIGKVRHSPLVPEFGLFAKDVGTARDKACEVVPFPWHDGGVVST